ncbi:MAG: 4Fe-4S dicluster domain-containing protein, partial [Bacillota bacterium]
CPMKALRWSDVLGAYDLPVAEVDAGKCVSCGVCQEFCPDCAILVISKRSGECMTCATCEWVCTNGAIYVREAREYALDDGKCLRCGDCFRACPTGAMSRKAKFTR